MAQLMSTPGTLISPHIVPASCADMFFALNAGDLALTMDTYLEQIKSTMNDEEYSKMQEGISKFETEIGLNLKNDVLMSLTGEFGFAMSVDSTEAGLSSLQNGLMLFVGVKDRDKCKMVIERFLSKEQVERKKYKGIEMTYIPSTTGPEGPMGYAFTGDLLVFSSIKRITSVINEDVPLVTSERFSQIGSRLPQTYSTLFYLDPSKAMTKLSVPLSQNEDTMSELQAFGSIGGAVIYDGQGYKMKLTGTQGKSWLEAIGSLVYKMKQSLGEQQSDPERKMDE
jgi:hypothetical protein